MNKSFVPLHGKRCTSLCGAGLWKRSEGSIGIAWKLPFECLEDQRFGASRTEGRSTTTPNCAAKKQCINQWTT